MYVKEIYNFSHVNEMILRFKYVSVCPERARQLVRSEVFHSRE